MAKTCNTWECAKKGKHPATDHPDALGASPSTDVMDRLPRVAWVIEPASGDIVQVRRGIKGYYPTRQPAHASREEREALAASMNRDDGVTEWQAEAMLIGSLMGFDVPGADPAFLEASAKERKPAAR